MHKDEESYIPPSKYALIHKAVIDRCDALDGVKDGVLEDPTRCHFDPIILACKDADGPACLTSKQVEAARRVFYWGAINPRTKHQIFPGLEPGSEMAWDIMGGPRPFAIGNDFFKYVVFKNPEWDYRTLDFDKDAALAEQTDNGLINAMDLNLKPFFAHGGKLIQYHGWNDWQISPLNSVHYYENVLVASGGAAKVTEAYRLFMAPGMGHCTGSDGPNQFDMVGPWSSGAKKGRRPKDHRGEAGCGSQAGAHSSAVPVSADREI